MNKHGVNIQKVCWYCRRRSVRYKTPKVPTLLRFIRESKGVRIDTYAHPDCLKRKHGPLWGLLCDPTEYRLWRLSKEESWPAKPPWHGSWNSFRGRRITWMAN